MASKADTSKARLNRHRRMRGRVTGTTERPHLSVFHSTRDIYAQIIDDVVGVTLMAVSTLDKEFTDSGRGKETVKQVGKLAAERVVEKGVTGVVLDRGGYIFHDRVKELAGGACEGDLKF